MSSGPIPFWHLILTLAPRMWLSVMPMVLPFFTKALRATFSHASLLFMCRHSVVSAVFWGPLVLLWLLLLVGWR